MPSGSGTRRSSRSTSRPSSGWTSARWCATWRASFTPVSSCARSARYEAKRLDGVGRCGRQYCCSSWLPELRPVSLSLAKDQHLSLNPSQISGGCGRLLCCLRYEHDFYVQTRKRFPKEGRILRTAAGAERVLAVDIFRETVTVRLEGGGDTRVVTLEKLTAEMARVEPPVA